MLSVGSGENAPLLQVSQPRRPCYRLAAWHALPELPRLVQDSGRTGWYARVLRPGQLHPGAALHLVRRGPAEATVAEVNRLLYRDRTDQRALVRLLAAVELPVRLGEALAVRVRTGVVEDETPRLRGPAEVRP